MAVAGGPQCDLLSSARWRHVAASAKRPAAAEHGLRLVQPDGATKGLFETINHLLVMADRERGGREASPSAAVLDSQSVKTTESGGPRGYDAGKKVKGRKRQVRRWSTPTGVASSWSPSRPTSRTGTAPPRVLRLSRRYVPFIAKAFADSEAMPESNGPRAPPSIAIEIVRKPSDQVGFAVHPRRWVVERFFAWISRNRRLWKEPPKPLSPPTEPSSTQPPSCS